MKGLPNARIVYVSATGIIIALLSVTDE